MYQKNGHKQTITFSHFAKHRLLKKNILLQPSLHQKLLFFNFGFFETQNIDVEQKT